MVGSKCVIFPKGKTTWEGFQRPFKDGDILAHTQNNRVLISLVKGEEFKHNSIITPYCILWDKDEGLAINEPICFYADETRFATEEEKQKLFDAIKANGYKWNAETRTLEKLIVPKFKVGNRVERISTHEVYIIDRITSNGYMFKNEGGCGFRFDDEYLYKLVPNKFDISTLKPFESRVLARSDNYNLWKPAIFGFLYEKGAYMVGGVYWKQVIPYEGNEHLLGTSNDCDEYYKTW